MCYLIVTYMIILDTDLDSSAQTSTTVESHDGQPALSPVNEPEYLEIESSSFNSDTTSVFASAGSSSEWADSEHSWSLSPDQDQSGFIVVHKQPTPCTNTAPPVSNSLPTGLLHYTFKL